MIKVGDRVFYYEGFNESQIGFGLVIDAVQKSEKYKFTIHKKKILIPKVFLILKDNGQLEEFVELDLKKVVDI